MKPIKLCINQDGNVAGLWADEISWQDLGRLTIRRASRVEFDHAQQAWTVYAAQPANGTCHGIGLFTAKSREEALQWEHYYFGVGGPGWRTRS